MVDQAAVDKKVVQEVRKQAALLREGCVDVAPRGGLEAKIARSIERGAPLRVKLGIDPTGAHVHIGHAVVYRKIRQFQDLGHTAVLIIGDYTARIGDPTDLDGERPPLSKKQVEANAESYTDQILKVVREDRSEIRFQSEWFDEFSLEDIIRLNSHFSMAHMLSHETFRKRLDDGNRLSLHEVSYPVLQAFDSVQVEADVEIGGTDQTFNCLCGRDLMKARGMEPQIVMTMPLLPGTDGRKMSKSLRNDVPLLDPPEEMFGKLMSIADEILPEYLLLVQGLSNADVDRVVAGMQSGDLHPMEVKKNLAFTTVEGLHSFAAAVKAREQFESVFSRREEPREMQEYVLDEGDTAICAVLKQSGLAGSTSEARRLIEQRGVRVDGNPITDVQFKFSSDYSGRQWVVKVGKRRFLRVRR